VEQRELDEPQPGPAVLLGEGQTQPAQLGHLAPERLAVAARVVLHGPHVLGLAVLLEQRPGGVLQQDLVVGEGKVHRAAPARSARVSLGSPRMRSPMTFFWISEEPA
jgi:hypothetical protein